jgi:hypothetical protein
VLTRNFLSQGQAATMDLANIASTTPATAATAAQPLIPLSAAATAAAAAAAAAASAATMAQPPANVDPLLELLHPAEVYLDSALGEEVWHVYPRRAASPNQGLLASYEAVADRINNLVKSALLLDKSILVHRMTAAQTLIDAVGPGPTGAGGNGGGGEDAAADSNNKSAPSAGPKRGGTSASSSDGAERPAGKRNKPSTAPGGKGRQKLVAITNSWSATNRAARAPANATASASHSAMSDAYFSPQHLGAGLPEFDV